MLNIDGFMLTLFQRARRARFLELDQKDGSIRSWKRTDPWLGGDGKGGMKTIDNEVLFPKKPKTIDADGKDNAPPINIRSSDYTVSHWRPSPEEEGEDRQ